MLGLSADILNLKIRDHINISNRNPIKVKWFELKNETKGKRLK